MWRMDVCCGTVTSRNFGSSLRLVMPAELSVPRLPPITRSKVSPCKTNRCCDNMKGSYLGPEFSQVEIERRLTTAGAKYIILGDDELLDACVDALESEKAVGWFQGRMEFGPRALGGRSILGDARSPKMQSMLNLKVKFRESFRPFAPSVLREHVCEWFELDQQTALTCCSWQMCWNSTASP